MKIKSILISTIAILGLSVFSANAQNQDTFVKNDKIVSVGVGLFGQSLGKLTIPPITAAFEYGVVDNLFKNGNGSIGIGAKGGYYQVGYKNETGSVTSHSGLVGGIATLHYQFIPRLDTYAGLFLGAYLGGASTNIKTKAGEATVPGKGSAVDASFGWGLHLGARYYITNQFAINGELGYGYSILNLGVTFKF